MADAARTTRLQMIRPFTTKVFNRFSRQFVYRLPGFAVIGYVGRKSGKRYRIPRNAFRRGDTFVFALTYGPDVQHVVAIELNGDDAAAFIRNVLAPHARRSRFGGWFVRAVDKVDIEHPDEAAVGRPVFELHPA